MARLGWTFSPEQRQRLRDADTKWKSKTWLRSGCTFLAFLAMCLFAAAVAQSLHWMHSNGFDSGNDWQDGMCLAPVLLSLIFSPLLAYISLSRPIKATKKPLHPIIPLIIDFIIWALCIPSIVFSVGTAWFWYWQPIVVEIGGLIPCEDFNFWSKPCQPDIYRIGGIEIAANIFLCLLAIFHFTLFVLSIISLIRLRRRNRLSRTHPNLDQATAQRNIELQYHRSPEEHAQNSPSGVPPAYVSGVPPDASGPGLHRGDGKSGNERNGGSFDSQTFDRDHTPARFEKDLEAGRNPFGDEHESKDRSVAENIQGAVKYM